MGDIKFNEDANKPVVENSCEEPPQDLSNRELKKNLHAQFNTSENVKKAAERLLKQRKIEMHEELEGKLQDKKEEFSEEPDKFIMADKTKEREYYNEANMLALTYKGNMDEDFDEKSYEYGKIIDWEGIDTGAIVNRLLAIVETICEIQLFPYQVEIARRIIESIVLCDGDEITILVARQAGKCLGKDTPVMMYDGTIKLVQDIKQGDLLMGDDSTPRTVLSTTSGRSPLYRISPRSSYGGEFVVNDKHILSLKKRRENEIIDISVQDYLDSSDWAKKENYRGYRVPVEFDKVQTKVDPYFMGLWLGGGRNDSQSITTADKEIVDFLKEYADKIGYSVSVHSGTTDSYSIISGRNNSSNIILDELRNQNLINNKYIPHSYKCNSVDNRLQLLAGLIDSDGHIPSRESHKNTGEFTSKDKALAEDFLFLCRSLGLRAVMEEKIAKCEDYSGLVYRVSFFGDLSVIPTKVRRKQVKTSNLTEDPLTYGFDLEELGEGDYYGFQLDGNHRFLLGDFSVTHNSEVVADTCVVLAIMMPVLADFFPQLHQFKNGFYIGVFAPTTMQSETIGDRIRLRAGSEAAEAFIRDPEIAISMKDLKFSNGSFIRIHSAATQAKIESKTYHLIVLDECQDIPEDKILKCYSEDTPINRADGTTFSIKDIVDYKCNVLSPTEEVTPTHWMDTGVQGCYRFKLDNGRELSVTREHKHLVYRKGWKKTRQMTTQEIIDFEGKPGYDLRIVLPDWLPYFGNYGSYDKGLILGYFLGDGCLSNVPQFCGMYDDWERLNKAVFSEFDCKVNVRHPNFKNGLIEGSYKKRTGYKNPLTEWFKEIGIWGEKGENKSIPNLPYTEDFVKGLISGLIETDGCIENFNVKPIISFANISEKLVRGLQDQLLKFGVHSRVFSRKQNGDFGSRPKDMWVLHVKDVESIRRFQRHIPLNTKQEKLDIAVITLKGKEGRNTCKYYSSQYRFSRIVDISDEGLKQTYCVTVPTEEHLIIANGIVSGNSIHPMGAACITGDSYIPLEDGRVVRLKDFPLDIKTGCFSEDFKFASNKPIEFINSGTQKCLNLTLSSGKSITGTLDHPVIVKPREYPRLPVWRELSEVKVGDRVAVPKIIPYFGSKSIGEDKARILGILVGDGTCGQTKSSKRVPSTIWTSPKNEVAEFLGGLFDTAGSIQIEEGRKCTIGVSQANENILVEVSHLLIKFGVQSSIRECVSNGNGFAMAGSKYYRLEIRDRDSVLNFGENIRFFIKRKHCILAEACKILKAKRSKRTVPVIKGTGDNRKAVPLNVDLVFEKVSSKEDAGLQQVYDIAMPDGFHNFIANNIVVHNTSATICKLGTPHDRQCEFLDAIKRNKRLYHGSRGKIQNHFEFDYRVVQKYNARYKKFIEKEKLRLGEDSDYFRMAYRIEWLLNKGMVISDEEFEDYLRDTSLKYETVGDSKYIYVAGLDLGKKFDSTVLTIMKLEKRDKLFRDIEEVPDDIFLDSDWFKKKVVYWAEYEGDNWEIQIEDVIDVIGNFQSLRALTIDSTGVGDPITEFISRRLQYKDIEVYSLIYTLQNKHVLSQLFFKNVNHDNIKIPSHAKVRKTRKWRKFYQQLMDAEKVWKNNKMVIQHPKSKSAKDDYIQSLLLSLYSAEEYLNTGGIQVSPNVLYGNDAMIGDYNYDTVSMVDRQLKEIDITTARSITEIRQAIRDGRYKDNRAQFNRS